MEGLQTVTTCRKGQHTISRQIRTKNTPPPGLAIERTTKPAAAQQCGTITARTFGPACCACKPQFLSGLGCPLSIKYKLHSRFREINETRDSNEQAVVRRHYKHINIQSFKSALHAPSRTCHDWSKQKKRFPVGR